MYMLPLSIFFMQKSSTLNTSEYSSSIMAFELTVMWGFFFHALVAD